MDEPTDESCIMNEELAASPKLEREIAKGEDSKLPVKPPESRKPPSRTTLAILGTVAGSVTLAWFAFLVWVAFKGVSLL